jgi:lipoyl-dependent peroxiredoxin
MEARGRSDWTGSWRTGTGSISTASPAIDSVGYTFTTRFVDNHGVAPEELLAVAHASCFNQALANNLDQVRLTADTISTSVAVDYGITAEGVPTVNGSHITVTASVPGADDDAFLACVERAARGCAISRVLTCDITTTATLQKTPSGEQA